MASIIKKKIKNHIYYYYVETKRVNGKSRYINQKYLGTAETILKKFTSESKIPEPLFTDILDFADISLLFDIAQRINLSDIINEFSGKKVQGLSVGEYILIAAINRVVDPTSKNAIGKWFDKTILSKLILIKRTALTSQNYWNNMCLTDDEIIKIEDKLVKNILDAYKIDTSHLIYDATNFFTYIDTMQDSSLAKRGHCKSKRNDLRIVGLSMMITPDCNLPLLYDTYPGNTPDSKQFAIMLDKLKERYERLTLKKTDITIIFDRGNNSEDNIDLLDNKDFPLFYVGGLKRNQCADLFEIPKSQFSKLSGTNFEKVITYRTIKKVYKRNMTVIVTHNQNLADGQMQGILINIDKAIKNLSDLQRKLLNRAEGITTKGKKPTKTSVEKQVNDFLKTEFMKDVFDFEMTTYNDIPFFKYSFNEKKLEDIKRTILGKTVLFTNRHNWSDDKIVGAYRSAWHIEHSFRQLKNTEHLTVRPLFHWTDQKIKIHIFYCILAFRLCCLLTKKLQNSGIDISINRLFDELNEIKYVTTVFGAKNSDIVYSISKGSSIAEKIVQIYQLKDKYMPVR